MILIMVCVATKSFVSYTYFIVYFNLDYYNLYSSLYIMYYYTSKGLFSSLYFNWTKPN